MNKNTIIVLIVAFTGVCSLGISSYAYYIKLHPYKEDMITDKIRLLKCKAKEYKDKIFYR